MASLTIKLTDDELWRLTQKADALGLTAEELVKVEIDEILASPDDKFVQAVHYVVKKNDKLYKRLARCDINGLHYFSR